MGLKTVQPKLDHSFSLEQAVRHSHLVRRLAAVIDFSFVHDFVHRHLGGRWAQVFRRTAKAILEKPTVDEQTL
jgi:hypothetical protein